MAGIGVGVGVGLCAYRPAVASGSNANLLNSPEAFDNAAWTKVAVTVTADYGDPTYPGADRLVMPNSRQSAQVTSVAATSGSTIANVSITSSWARYTASATVDGVPYTFSVELISISGSANLRLQINVPAGFISVSILNASGSSATFGATRAKLEQAASFSAYP